MDTDGIIYLAKTIGNLSGIPIRVYKNDKLILFHSAISIPKDPVYIYLSNIFAIKGNIGYFITKDLHAFGLVKHEETRIIIGPTIETEEDDKNLRVLAFDSLVPNDKYDEFISAMKAITHMSFSSLLEILCTLNFALNGEKKEIKDLTINDSTQEELKRLLEMEGKGKTKESGPNSRNDTSSLSPLSHNTYDSENQMLMLIRKGNVDELKKWISSAPSIRGGTIAGDQLRQIKNTFVVSATLASRAAIQGGVDQERALSASDVYIRRAELLSSYEKIMNLQYIMVLDYAEMVRRIRGEDNFTPFTLKVKNYVLSHISENLSTQEVADALFLSRPYLSSKFHKEAGITLYTYIMDEKIEEAKRLLLYSPRSISDISQYLSFSSLGHFSAVFKEKTGLTPSEYRSK